MAQTLDELLKEYMSWAYELGVKDGTGLPEVRKEAKAAFKAWAKEQNKQAANEAKDRGELYVAPGLNKLIDAA